jgi:hypothetical protein
MMSRILQTLMLVLVIAVSLPTPASADFWTRSDRPWLNEELDRAIAFCRMQSRIDPNIGLFVDMVMGQQIDRCMHALGWTGVAR